VTANSPDGGTLSYQWYSNTSATNAGGTSLGTSARSASFNPSTDAEGTYYFFVEVKNTIPNNGDGGKKTAKVRSNAVEFRVSPSSEIVIDLTGMDEWELTEQTAEVNAYENKVFTVTGNYAAYRWYLNGVTVGTSSGYTFNRPVGVYELVVVVTSSNGESRSGRCRITVLGLPERYPRLTDNVWFNGEITMATGEDRYLISVTAGTTYHIWWNDSFQGNGSKTADVVVGAQYTDSSTWIFGGTDTAIDDGWDTGQSFTANQTGTVEIRVIPYNRYSQYIGTYGIVYSSTGSTRPAVQ
jgi:hypothetical protein